MAYFRIAGIVFQEFYHGFYGRPAHIVKDQNAADPQQAGGVETIQQRVIEGMPAVDENQIQLVLALFQQLGQRKFRPHFL